MGQLSPEPNFTELYQKPTIRRMVDELSDHEFEHFVKYVFEQAGYFVEDSARQPGHGLDLKLYTGPAGARTFHAGVQVKHFNEAHKVSVGDIRDLRGGLPYANGVVGYFITTSSFHDQALDEAKAAGKTRIWTLDGEHFLRYISYVRGTRHGVSAAVGGYSQNNTVFAPISPDALVEADLIQHQSSAVQVLTVANHKGGVGKTTTALNLAFGLASHDKQVLLIDMDAQANLTRALAYPAAKEAKPRYLDEYFSGTCSLASLVSPTKFAPIWLIPSRHTLIHFDKGLAAGPEAELQFTRDLNAALLAPPTAINARPFDWIIMDTGPWMGFFTRSALAASRDVIVPIAPGVFADLGLEFLVETVSTMHALTGQPIEVLGCLITQWSSNALNKSLLASVDAALALARIRRMTTEIPLDKNNIERAHLETGQGKSKNLFDRRCEAAKAYTTVVNEVLNHVESRS